MARTTKKTLITFWAIAIPLLVLWHVTLQMQSNSSTLISAAHTAAKVLPLGDKNGAAIALADYMLQKDDVERTFLILLQNNLELRPGGGYIGSFAIVKVKNGQVRSHEVHNTNIFDGRVPHSVPPPYPMAETLNIPSWQMRDANFSPDFPTNALRAEDFYHMGDGQEEFDGIIAVNATLLEDLLAITGPIRLDGYPGVYKSGDAVVQLEYQVEQGFHEQKLEKAQRKAVLSDLAGTMIERVSTLPLRDKITLAKEFIAHFDSKDIQVLLRDPEMQRVIASVGWDGRVDTLWDKDFLMVVDANLASLKSDYFMKRAISYDVDLSGSIPQAVVRISYEHTAQRKDWMTHDYQTFLRVYAPENTWFVSQSNNASTPVFGDAFGKKYIGFLVHVPIGTQKTVEVRYNLPQAFKNQHPYDLKIQKQSGVKNAPVSVQVTGANGESGTYQFVLDQDVILSDL